MIKRDRLSFLLCVASVLLAVLAVGGATRPTQAAIAMLSALALSATIMSRRTLARWPPLVVVLLAASAITCLQLVPLPDALVEAVTPTLDGLRDDGAHLAAVSSASTLSVDPGATLRALIFLLTLTGVAIVALRLSVSESGRYLLMACVAGTAGIAAGVAGIHELLGATRLYGLYEPRQLPPILGPLLNTNHLGSLMAVGAVASASLVFYPKQSALRRGVWLVVALGCVLVTTATFSRGAVIGLAAGVAVLLATLLAQRMNAVELAGARRKREKLFVTTVPIGVIVVCMLFLAVYLGGGTVMNQLESTSLDELQAPRTKYAAWVSSLELVKESPWVGVGRGAFESAFTRVHPASAYSTFSHAENEVVQAVVEWGIPATLLLFALAGWVMLLALRRWKDGPLAAGGLAALMVIAFQSNFDFGIELLGLAVPVTVVLATLTYVPLVESAPRRIRRTQVLRIAHAAAIVAGGVLLLTSATRTLEEDHRRLLASPSPSLIAESIEAHPLDYMGYAVLADERFRAGDRDAVSLLNHALRLHPTHSDLHWIAARLLVRANLLGQAESEYTVAVRYARNPAKVLAELVKVLPAERAASAVPLELPIESTVQLLRPDIAALWLERIVIQTGDIRAADRLYSLGRRWKNWEVAERGARHRCRIMPSARCTIELAGVLQQAGKPEEVIATLGDVADWRGRSDDQVAAWLMLCESFTAARKPDDAAECLRRLEASGLRDTPP